MRCFLGFLLLLVFCFANASLETPIHIELWSLPNGANAYFVRAPQIPMVDINVVFAAGSIHDGNSLGLASFVNAMLNEGTEKHSANQLSDGFDSVGAAVGGNVNQDMSTINLRSLTERKYFLPALELFTEMINQPAFPSDAIQRVKNQTISSIEIDAQTPSEIASKAFYHLIYGNFPYGHSPDGTVDSVKQITETDIRQFYQRYYVGKNTSIILVGDLTREQAESIAKKLVGTLPSGEASPKFSTAENTSTADKKFIPLTVKQSTILIGQIGIGPNDPNYFPLILGNQILGGAPLSSLLFEKVRSQHGLVYDISSTFSTLQYRGPFVIALQTRTDQAKKALAMTQNILQQFVNDGPTSQQLKAAQQNLVGAFPLAISTNADILAVVLKIGFYHLPLDYLNHYVEHVESVTVPQIKSAWQKTIHPASMKMVVVGKQNSM